MTQLKFSILSLVILFAIGLGSAFAGPNKDLRCNDWLNGDRIGYDSDVDRVLSHDGIGTKGVCRDFYPTWGERFKFERSNEDPFTVTYEVSRQYCWARNIVWGGGFKSNRETGQTYCGQCRMNFLFCKSNGWSPPRYTSWGHSYSEIFSYDELNSGDQGWSVKKGPMPFSHVCLRRYAKGDKFKHDADGPAHDNYLPKVCAYLVNFNSCNSPVLNWGHSLIGCIDEPVKPGPPVYNKIILGTSVAFVDSTLELTDYLAKGSTFDQPMVELSNGKTGGEKISLMLRYKFPGDTRVLDGTPTCGFFPDEDRKEYCAAYNSSKPDQICACLREECDKGMYVGCAPRPNLEQSNLKIKTDYTTHEEIDGRLAPAISFQIITTDASGAETGVLPLTSPAVSVREYFNFIQGTESIIQRDTTEVYGVKFAAMIPKFVDDKPEYIRIATPDSMFAITGCFHFAKFPLSDKRWPKFYVPAGNRNKVNCQCLVEGVFCTIPPAKDCLKGGLIPHDEDAVDAFCPGLYTGPKDPGVADKICLLNDSAFDFITQTDGLCVELKSACAVTDYPSAATGYALFENPELKKGESEEGTCDPAAGYENVLNYKNSIDYSRLPGGIAGNLLKQAFSSIFSQAEAFYTAHNMNIPPKNLRILETAFNNLIKINDPEELLPTRICSGDSLVGEITNPCRILYSCNDVRALSYNFFGAKFNSVAPSQRSIGTCQSPFVQQDGAPSIKCNKADLSINQDVLINGNDSALNINLDAIYWDRNTITNPCDKP